MADDTIGSTRQPYKSESKYFRKNPKVAGMATSDDKVILNPFSGLTLLQKNAVVKNERSRLLMRKAMSHPIFALTKEQKNAFKRYSSLKRDVKETIAARIASGDPSAGRVTTAQRMYVQERLNSQLKRRGW